MQYNFRLILIIFLLLCPFYISAKNIENNLSLSDSIYLDLVGKADSAIALDNWAEAEAHLLTAIDYQPANPANTLLLSNLALIQFQQGNDSLALATINDACSIAPKSITVLNNRARIHKAMGMIDDAYSDYEKIINIDSTLIEPLYMHGIIALSKSDFLTAQHDFNKLEQLAPNDILTYDAMAMLHYQLQDYPNAIPYFSKLIESNPTPDYYHDKIICLLFDNQLSEASANIYDAMKLYPHDGNFYLLRALLNRLYYRQSDAENDIKKAIELGVPKETAKLWMKVSIPSK